MSLSSAAAVESFTISPQERQIDINVQLFRYEEEALAKARTNRPKNTKRTYDPKQKEWVDFCKKINFSDGELVTERKLIRFLEEHVLKRPVRSSRYKKPRTNEDGQIIEPTLSRSAVSSYTSAIVNLWAFQRSSGITTHLNPQEEASNATLRTHSHQEHVRKRKQFVDRVIGTLIDGYDENEKAEVIRSCWRAWQSRKSRKKQSVKSFLRTGFGQGFFFIPKELNVKVCLTFLRTDSGALDYCCRGKRHLDVLNDS